MRISEVAKQTGLNVSNVRFYERKGLLKPEREDENNYREYTEADIVQIKEILLYRKMGISIESIYLLLNEQADQNDIISRNLTQLEEQMESLQGAIDLSKMVLNKGIKDAAQIDYYLSYVHKEEIEGKRFSEIQELLEDIDDFTKDSLAYWRPWTMLFGRWPWVSKLLAVLLWSTIILIPVMHLVDVYAGKSELSPLFLCVYAVILFGFGKGFWEYRKKPKDDDKG